MIRHLLTVWNPAYAEGAMDAHLAVLLRDAARVRAAGEAVSPETVYVWWGKLRSANRQGRLPHSEEIASLYDQIQQGIETHLYLTDYRSLYVGLLDDIDESNIFAEYDDELEHAPEYYREHFADFWFRLTDIRRIVTDDTLAVVNELKTLRNQRYHDRPVSLYGGMVELPLIVRREGEAARWFADRNALTGGRLWAEYDAERRTETERVAHTLRDDLFGRAVWEALEPASRAFLASAEAMIRSRRDDPAFDFGAPFVEYAKTIEVELNALLFDRLRRVWTARAGPERRIRVDAHTYDAGERVPHLTLGALRTLIERSGEITAVLRTGLAGPDADWILGLLPRQLAVLAELRNTAAHSGSAARDAVLARREELIGIGHEGLIVRIARVKLRLG